MAIGDSSRWFIFTVGLAGYFCGERSYMVTYLRNHPLVALTGLAALLRLPTLAIESLWYDEAFTAWLASLSVWNLLSATMGDVHPPLWYLIEWTMVRLAGNSPFVLRLVSALAGIALVPAVYRLAQSFNFDRSRALAAAALTAIAPFAVYYSQEARSYSLIYLCTTLAAIGLLERRWWLLIACSTLALYLHNLSFFYIAALGWLALYRYRLDWKPLACFALVGLLWLPWVIFGLIPQLSYVGEGFWVREPTLGTPAYIMVGWLFSEKAASLVLVTAPLFTLALLQSKPRVDLLGLFLIPICLCTTASILFTPVLVGRVVGSSAIALYLIIAPSLIPTSWPKSKSFKDYALPAFFAFTLLAFYPLYWGTDRVGRYQWQLGLDEFSRELRPDDGLFHGNLATYIILKYYLPENEQIVWKQANDLSQSLRNETKWAMQMDQEASFDAIACDHRRWWIAFYENPTTGDDERREIDRIVKQYNGRLFSTMVRNDLVDARIYLVEEPCNKHLAGKKSS